MVNASDEIGSVEQFRKLLIEAQMLKAESILENFDEKKIRFTEEHIRAMDRIQRFGFRGTAAGRRRRWAALIAAVLLFLLLGGITVYGFHHAWFGFFVERFGDHAVVYSDADKTDESAGEKTFVHRIPSYIPEKYTEVERREEFDETWVLWTTEEGDSLFFVQRTAENSTALIDTEHTEFSYLEIAGKKVMHSYSTEDSAASGGGAYHGFQWSDGNYHYALAETAVGEPTSLSEFERIIDSLEER